MIQCLRTKNSNGRHFTYVKVIISSLVSESIIWNIFWLPKGWAVKRGYFTAKACRPDVYRAANELLRMALDGRLCISLKPRDYFGQREFWKEHPETQKLNDVINSVELIVKEKLERMEEEPEGEYESEEEDEDGDQFKKNLDSDEEEESDQDEHNVAKNPYALLDQQE